MMTKNIKQLVRLGNDYIIDYLLTECDVILDEQRKIDVQIDLLKASNIIRGRQVTKKLLMEFIKSINQINFKDTTTIKIFKENIKKILNYYDEYYTDDGIRKI